MAVASDYSNWVRELDKFQADADKEDRDDAKRDDLDARHETTNGSEVLSSRLTSRTGVGISTSRSRNKERPPSQADELQQEMKLLNWHKLANEAALKAAIIKTNKIKREDSHVARSMNHEDAEDKQMRIQQIIEEEQLRPLEVNSEFYRDFESKEQHNDAKLENDVQRHVQHLKRLKETMAQREDLQRRRQKYRDGMLELTNGTRSTSVLSHNTSKNSKNSSNSNQDDDHSEQRDSKRHQRSSSMYSNRANGASTANAQVFCSLDKLMELEKRIRHLEDAGLGADALEDDPRIEGDSVGSNNSRATSKGGAGLHFSKRRSAGGPHEPSKTMYAVKTSARGAASKANKARARDKPRAARPTKPQATFLTALPDNKQRQLRRMGERERRQFLKHEKAGEVREQKLKQDVVIDGWLDKKRQAASNRKAVSSQVRSAQTGAPKPRGGAPAANSTARHPGGKSLPLPPKVRAPAVGAASGKRIANPHTQKFDDIKKGFERRNDALKRAPVTTATSVKTSHSTRGSAGGSTLPGGNGGNRRNPTNKYASASTRDQIVSQRVRAGPAVLARTVANAPERGLLIGHKSANNNPNSHFDRAIAPKVPGKQTANSSSATHTQPQKLPVIARATAIAQTPQFGLTNSKVGAGSTNASVSSTSSATLGPTSAAVGQRGVALPRLVTQTNARSMPAPSPPPLALKNTMPQFSRLNKR